MSDRRRAGVLGHPIDHSLSPALHLAAYAELGLSGRSYERHDVTEDGFARFWAGLDQACWSGLSLTMPLKRVVRSHLARVSDLATAVGAVNTVIFTDDGPFGENTDVYGIVAALAEVGLSSLKGAAPPVILGGGATAASALGAVREMGAVEVCVLVRSPDRAKDLPATAGRLGLELTVRRFEAKYVAHAGGALSEDVPLIVSTLPAGAGGDHVSALSERFSGAVWPVLLDVAYDPWPSDLAAAWAERGATSANGFSMLLHQAAEQVRLMTGCTAPIETMRAAGVAELARRHGNGA